jgi:hypothetical protein
MSMTAEDLLVEQAPAVTRTANDRCARCGAQAYTRWALTPDLADGTEPPAEIDFCNHHTTRHAEALAAQEFVMVIDERDRLLVQRESSADA